MKNYMKDAGFLKNKKPPIDSKIKQIEQNYGLKTGERMLVLQDLTLNKCKIWQRVLRVSYEKYPLIGFCIVNSSSKNTLIKTLKELMECIPWGKSVAHFWTL